MPPQAKARRRAAGVTELPGRLARSGIGGRHFRRHALGEDQQDTEGSASQTVLARSGVGSA
jgi:hypothetical protein